MDQKELSISSSIHDNYGTYNKPNSLLYEVAQSPQRKSLSKVFDEARTSTSESAKRGVVEGQELAYQQIGSTRCLERNTEENGYAVSSSSFFDSTKNNSVVPPTKTQNNVDRATGIIDHAHNQGGDNGGNNGSSDDRNENRIGNFEMSSLLQKALDNVMELGKHASRRHEMEIAKEKADLKIEQLLSSHAEEMTRARDREQTLRSKINVSDCEINDLRQNILLSKQELIRFQQSKDEEVTAMKIKLGDVQKLAEKKISELVDVQTLVEQYRIRSVSLEEDLTLTKTYLKDEQDKCNDLKAKLDKAEDKISILNDDISMERDYREESERKNAETEERLTDMTSSKEESDARIENAFGKLVLLASEYKIQEQNLTEKEDIIHESNRTLNNTKKALANAEEEASTLHRHKRELEKKYARAKEIIRNEKQQKSGYKKTSSKPFRDVRNHQR